MIRPETRAGSESDLPALTDIYNHYAQTTHVAFDLELLSVDDRRPWFAQFDVDGAYRIFVADGGGEIVGYACSSPIRPKPAYATSVETTVYVRPGHEGRGLGRGLYGRLFQALETEEVYRAYAVIALPNEASIHLHERFGFRRAGLFTAMGRKLGRFWDVAWYEKRLREV